MRTRKEIEEEIKKYTTNTQTVEAHFGVHILYQTEILLDIRDLLLKQKIMYESESN